MPLSPNRDKASKPPVAFPEAYVRLHSQFAWEVPPHFNIAEVCCRRWSGDVVASKNIAIHAYFTGTRGTFYSYADLAAAACQLSHALAGLGVQRGDRVAIVMPQSFETAVAYMAVLQMGAVAMPLSLLFGPEALEFRLRDSEAVVAIAVDAAVPGLQEARATCPQLRHVIGVAEAVQGQPTQYPCADTLADDPAVLIYTSGTTGNPKGALIPHRALIGNLSGFVCSQNWFGFDMFKPEQLAPVPARGGAGGRGEHKTGIAQSAGVQNTSDFW